MSWPLTNSPVTDRPGTERSRETVTVGGKEMMFEGPQEGQGHKGGCSHREIRSPAEMSRPRYLSGTECRHPGHGGGMLSHCSGRGAVCLSTCLSAVPDL